MKKKTVVVSSTVQYDPAMAAVGSTPFIGDLSATGIVLPEAATEGQDSRYLCRLCSLWINENEFVVIRQVHQLLTIGAQIDVGDQEDPTVYYIEVPVTDPTWCFQDGNVSWHIRRMAVKRTRSERYVDAVFTPPYASDREGATAAIIARRPIPYIPLNAGIPYGDPVGGLGTFRDMRFPWNQYAGSLNQEVMGPCQLTMFASVYQTNPDTRVQPPVDEDGTYMRQEDRFVINHPTARYWRVGARMECDIYEREPIHPPRKG